MGTRRLFPESILFSSPRDLVLAYRICPPPPQISDKYQGHPPWKPTMTSGFSRGPVSHLTLTLHMAEYSCSL